MHVGTPEAGTTNMTTLPSSPPGNEHNNFRINPSSGLLMRGVRPLDREQNSSHVLEVEAYNTEHGPMRSSVRVRAQREAACRDAASHSSNFQPSLSRGRRAGSPRDLETLTESLCGWRRGFGFLFFVFFL